MNFNFNINKDQVRVFGKNVWRVGKAIAIEGSKELAKNALLAGLDRGFKGGFKDIKNVGLDDIIGKEKPKQPKKKLFSKKNEAEELIEETKELAGDAKNVVDKQ